MKEREERERKERHERKKEKKERDRRDQERQTRHSEEQARARPESQRLRTPSQPHRHDGSPSTLSLEQSPVEARNNHRRSGDHERARTKHLNDSDNPAPARHPLERNPSTRPTSEFLSAADLVALRAKEAYDMERLFKARSLYGQEPDGATPNSIPSSNASEQGSSADAALHGSGHTSYVVQTPFQGKPRSQGPNGQQDPYSYLNDLEILSIPSLDSPNKPHTNPLPEPPRSSTYQPTPLTMLESNGAYSSDYWTKYTVTTAH